MAKGTTEDLITELLESTRTSTVTAEFTIHTGETKTLQDVNVVKRFEEDGVLRSGFIFIKGLVGFYGSLTIEFFIKPKKGDLRYSKVKEYTLSVLNGLGYCEIDIRTGIYDVLVTNMVSTVDLIMTIKA